MCDWTNLEEIMQDLSVAQRCEVPAPLETYNAVGPPAFNIKEEESAEQAYYASQGGGGGDFAAPDYELIQEMLNMVKKNNDDGDGDNPVNSSDLDPHSRELPKHVQKKTKRNVALTSIITAKESELSAIRPIPKDVIPVMFKKKSLKHTTHHNTEEPSKVVLASQTSPEKCKQYTPSTHASEYYTKYVQKSKMREEFEEDIWARAERLMKALEVRKKRKAEIVSPKESDNTPPPGVACAFLDVNLPEHRHLMPGECIVCIVAAKHGYYF